MANDSSPGETAKISSICTECGAPLSFFLGTFQVQCDHCDGGLVVEKGQGLVRLSCPRCAGNFYYLDGSMCGHCPYCDASLLAVCHDRLLRYVIRPEAERPEGAEDATLELLPFWHLQALLFGWDVGGRTTVEEERQTYDGQGHPQVPTGPIRKDSGPIKERRNRVVNISLPDPATTARGITSLRHRGAVFPLEPFAAEHESLGRVLPPVLAQEQARDQLRGRVMELGAPTQGMTRIHCQRLDLVATEMSLYYYPFWVLQKDQGEVSAWDAVTGQKEYLAQGVEACTAEARGVFDELKVLELECIECGARLPAGNHSMVLPCTDCGRFFKVTREGLESFSANYAMPALEADETVWLPFWCVPCNLSYGGRKALKVADMRTVLGVIAPRLELPRAPAAAQLRYFVSAYGALRAPKIDSAARDMTRLQPSLKSGSRESGEELFHCFFGQQDASDLAYSTWITVLPGVVPHRLRSLRIRAGEPQLWYVPFEHRGRELVNLLTGLRYDRDAFRGVRH